MYRPIALLLANFLFVSCHVSVKTESSREKENISIARTTSPAVPGRDFNLTIEDSQPASGDRVKSESIYGSHSDTIGFKNVRLRIVLAALLDQDTTEIESTNMASLNRTIDLAFKSKRSDNSENPSIILGALRKRFNFTVEKSSRQPHTWNLQVEDMGKLSKCFTGASNTKKIVTGTMGEGKVITIEHSDLTGLADGLSRLCDLKIVNKALIHHPLSMTLNFKDINDLQGVLDEYGISIKKSDDTNPYRFIRFN